MTQYCSDFNNILEFRTRKIKKMGLEEFSGILPECEGFFT